MIWVKCRHISTIFCSVCRIEQCGERKKQRLGTLIDTQPGDGSRNVLKAILSEDGFQVFIGCCGDRFAGEILHQNIQHVR